jgi:ribosomal-protein-alanine N-acetyltransferase
MSSIRPVLRIFDITKALEFYADWMGFTVDWEHRSGDNSPVYMQVSMDDIVFHLTEHYGDACPGAKYILNTAATCPPSPPASQQRLQVLQTGTGRCSLGGKCMELTDPFGNKLLFCNNENA